MARVLWQCVLLGRGNRLIGFQGLRRYMTSPLRG